MNDMIAKQEGEKIKRENDSKIEWTRLNAKEVTTYDIDDIKNLRLKQLTEKVADLCDLQPTPVSMVRPPRKVPSPRLARRARLCAPQLTTRAGWQEMLSDLRKELKNALADVETEIDAMGGSVSDVMSAKSKVMTSAPSVKSAASSRASLKAPTLVSAVAPVPE